jgi:hypothetical protein
MDWLNWWIIALAGIVTLCVAVRLALRFYFPPDT